MASTAENELFEQLIQEALPHARDWIEVHDPYGGLTPLYAALLTSAAIRKSARQWRSGTAPWLRFCESRVRHEIERALARADHQHSSDLVFEDIWGAPIVIGSGEEMSR